MARLPQGLLSGPHSVTARQSAFRSRQGYHHPALRLYNGVSTLREESFCRHLPFLPSRHKRVTVSEASPLTPDPTFHQNPMNPILSNLNLRRTPSARIPVLLCLLWAPCVWGADVVHLKDGSRQPGKVVELGGNRIDLVMQGGAKKILKKDIEKVVFDESRHQRGVEETDVVVRRGGHRIRGAVEIIDGGKKVRVTLEGGSTAELARSEVDRILRRGDPVENDTTVYTAELGARMDAALSFLLGESQEGESPSSNRFEGVAEAEMFLASCGIFAIDRVREALSGATEETEGTRALARVERLYRLKEVTASEIEQSEHDIYRILAGDDPNEKCDLLLLLLPRHVDASTPLAKFLAMDELQEPVVRAWSIEFLRRMQKNDELLDVCRRSTGRVQLAAAVALGRNRILLGVPTLFEAMEMDLPEVRELAAGHLRDFTGEDFGYRHDASPLARTEAMVRWRAWWQENEERFRELAETILHQERVETEERIKAIALWREASLDIDEEKYEAAAAKLREAQDTDPGFFQAPICLAVLLYSRLDKPEEAARVLTRLRSKPIAGMAPEARQWVYLHLGHSLRLSGDTEGALEAYKECRILNPENHEALMGLGDTAFKLATSDANLEAAARTENLKLAREAYQSAAEVLDRTSKRMRTLSWDSIPADVEATFDRRSYNRSVLGLRTSYLLEEVDARYKAAKVQAMLGEKKAAVLELRKALREVAYEETPESESLQVRLRQYLGLLFEDMDQPLLAYREYRTILEELDAGNPLAARGVERIRALLKAKEADGKK